MREWYRSKSPEERRALVDRRNKERARERDRARNQTPERRAHLARNTKQWRADHPERVAAHRAVAKAIRQGVLVRQVCESEGCGKSNTHAHHDDYARPLDVRWLCPLHHAAERRK